MAKNVVIRDVVYQNVPSVEIPLSGTSGVAQFVDTSDATLSSGTQMLDGVTAYANGTKVTGSIASKSGSDLTVSGATVTVPAGNYASQASKSVSSGTEGTPTATKGAVSNHAISVTPSVTNAEGWIDGGTHSGTAVTVSASELVSGTKSITENGTGIDVTNYAAVDVAVPSSQPNLQAKTNIDPTTSSQTIQADSGYDGLSSVQINAMPTASFFTGAVGEYYTSGQSMFFKVTPFTEIDTELGDSPGYVPEGHWAGEEPLIYSAIPTGTIITPTTSSQTIGGANYMMEGAVTVAAMPSGSVSASATKGSVSNHAISVTPTATVGTAGYLAAGSTNGTAVSVSASELVSGTVAISASGNTDVTNYATASVAAGGATASATKSISNHTATVTPSVTRTAGYVTAGSANGTAVTVSASELVSGSQTVTSNDTYDVTNLAELVVNVSGGGSSSVSVGTKTATLSSATSSISFTGLSGNPSSFVITSQSDVATNTDGVTAVVYDGTTLHGQTMTTQVEADTGFTKSYSSGTLTVTATTAQFQANAYKLAYTYDGSSSDIHTSDVQVGSGATSITFSSLSSRPMYWSCIFKSNFSTSSGYQRVICVANDGSSIYGLDMDSSAHAATAWTATYSGGNLTISSGGTNNGGYFHQPGYYQLTYAVDDSAPEYQTKTAYATTSAQTITPDSGYDALESVSIGAVSQTNLTAANIKSGTTITISNGQSNLWSVTGSYTGGGGGGATVKSTTWTNSSNTTTSHQFTDLSGTPIAAFLRCTSSLSRSSSSTNYFIADMVWNGTSCTGNSYRRSNGNYANVTSGYSVTTGSNSITFTSSGTSTTNPGSFYNGTYELTYVY